MSLSSIVCCVDYIPPIFSTMSDARMNSILGSHSRSGATSKKKIGQCLLGMYVYDDVKSTDAATKGGKLPTRVCMTFWFVAVQSWLVGFGHLLMPYR